MGLDLPTLRIATPDDETIIDVLMKESAAAYGFRRVADTDVTMPDGVAIPCVSIEKRLDA